MIEALLPHLKTWIPVIGVAIVIATFIIMWGPGIGLKSPWHYVVAVSVVVIALIIEGLRWYFRRRREKQFEEGILGQAQQDMSRASVARRAEIEALTQRWREAIRLLKETSAKGGGILQRLPWFAIIGEPQSGKSTLLRNSGLDFPVGDAQIHGIGGTKNCDWWFANEAIILDTAGRYAFEVQSAPDREEWSRFLALLKKGRKKKAINGLIVAVPADSLLQKNEDELRIYAQHLRGKINDMMTKLGIVFPVYLVVTKVDLVEGFVDFFSRYPANRVREAVGRTFDNVHPATSLEGASKTLDDLYDRLCSMSLGLMEEGDPGAPARPFLMFPEEFRNLVYRLKAFVEGLLRENIYMRNPVFRGVYITSGTQEGRTIAAAISDVASKLGLNVEALTTEHAADKPKRAYFVRDLLSKILIEDAQRDLVRPMTQSAKEQFMHAFGKVILPAAGVSAVILLWAFIAFGSNRTAWAGLRDYVAQNRYLGGGGQPRQPEEAKTSEAIQAFAELGEHRRMAVDRSAFLNLFLTRSDPAEIQYNRAFALSVEQHVLKPTLARMQATLEGSPGAPAEYVQDLAAYLTYRRALAEHSVGDSATLEGIAAPWARPDDRFGVWAKKKELADLIGAYARLGGQETGSIHFDAVGRRLQELVDRLQQKDQYILLRDLAQQSAPAVRSGTDSQAIAAAWTTLKGIIAAGSGSVKVPPELFSRMDRDMQALPDAQPAIAPLRQLAALLGGPGGAAAAGDGDRSAAFAEKVIKPLQEARDLPAPSCSAPSPSDPASVDKVAEALGGFATEIGKRSDAVKAGIVSFNANLGPSDQIAEGVVADVVRKARMSEVYNQCTKGWFEVDGPFNTASLYKAAGGVTSGSGAPQWVGPPGGAFQCLHPKPSAAAAPVNTAGLDQVGSSLHKLGGIPDVPSDLTSGLMGQWSSSRGAVGGGGKSGSYQGALARIELTVNPSSWTLDVVPDQLRAVANDGSLKTILDDIKKGLADEGSSTSAFRNFTADVYIAALNDIADKLEAALADRSPLGVVNLAEDTFSSPASSFDKAVKSAASAPNANLARQLDAVVKSVWEKLLDKAATNLDTFYAGQMKDQMKEFLGCYPFNASGGPCDAGRFTQMFGPGGTVSKLEGFAGDASDTAPRAKFGKSLPVGPSFQKMLQSAARIYRGYGANKDGVFELSFEASPTAILPEKGVKAESLLVEPQTTTLTLDGVSVSHENSIVSKLSAKVPLDDATSAVSVALKTSKKEGWFGKGWALDELDAGPLPQERGPWSFLQLLARGKSADTGACCVFDIPLVRKDKKEKLAVIRASFNLTSSPGKPSVLDPKFWKLDPPPDSVAQ